MKRIIASAGLVAVSATGLYGQAAPAETRLTTTKPWTVSAALRGFYDDNIVSAPNLSARKEESFGISVRPSASINLKPQEQTSLGASYAYGMKWYEARNDDPVDQTHEADFRLAHRFNPRYSASVSDSFVYSQEPELLEGAGRAQTTFLRTNLDAVRNRGAVEFNAGLTEVLGLALGYENSYYNYLDNDSQLGTLLDRIEHLIRVDGRYQARPSLVGIVGYQYGRNDFTSENPILPGNPLSLRGEDRSSQTHYGYVGAEYSLSKKLTAKGRVGAAYTIYNDLDQDTTSPYADISATYRYLPGSQVQLGLRQERNATDQFGGGTEDTAVVDQDSTVLYGSISHRITPRVTGSLLGQFQHSVFYGGNLDDQADNYLTVGLNLQYKITPMFSVETGYNYDRLDSDLGSQIRSFTRNRVYVGLRATY